MLAPVSRSARLNTVGGPAIGLDPVDDESNAKIADRYTTGSSARHGVAVGDLPASSVSAPQLVPRTLGSAPTPPVPEELGERGAAQAHAAQAHRARAQGRLQGAEGGGGGQAGGDRQGGRRGGGPRKVRYRTLPLRDRETRLTSTTVGMHAPSGRCAAGMAMCQRMD